MSRYRDFTSIENTCPIIDKVIYFIENIDWNLEDNDENALLQESKSILDLLEKIREANSGLRDFGNSNFILVSGLEKDNDYLKDQVQDLKQTVYDLEQDNKRLESELEEMENLNEK